MVRRLPNAELQSFTSPWYAAAAELGANADPHPIVSPPMVIDDGVRPRTKPTTTIAAPPITVTSFGRTPSPRFVDASVAPSAAMAQGGS